LPEASRIAEILRTETVGGLLLIVAAIIGLVWANSPWSDTYDDLISWTIGPSSLHLHLSLEAWAADGLLAIFFFVAGLELKREFVAGDLRDPRVAAVPVAAAVGGVIVPAALYVLVVHGHGLLDGWAIPTATDIAFALAVLAVIGSSLPSALRTFLLTLAVVDDLIAIMVIACFYTDHLRIGLFLAALVTLSAFGFLVQRRMHQWWLLLPLALTTWTLVHASGVHATVAGVLLALTVPVREGARVAGSAASLEHLWRPISTGFAVPVFALTSAGVALGGWDGFQSALTDRVAVAVIVALVVGKTIGVFGSTYLVARFTRAELDDDLAWVDVFGLAVLSGIGFTVSLLIASLAFDEGSSEVDHAKIAVFCGSLIAAVLAAVVLRLRNQVYRRIREAEQVDADSDGVPDAYP
jgi:NhaA family Na+:H+ antiporter